MDHRAENWYRRRTSHWRDWPLEELLEHKQRDLVDDLVVIDSDSTDATAQVAAGAGATVHRARDIAPSLGTHQGNGEALRKSLLVTRGDVLVFVEADLTQRGPHFVTGLLGPLLADPRVQLVKGFYARVRTVLASTAT
jgi:glucosyl-3-phosphoglycerate synthase